MLKRFLQKIREVSLFLLMLCFLPSQSLAIMKGLSTEELTKASEIVVIGDVEDVEAHWSKDGSTIFTSASIVIGDTVKGKIYQERVTVEYEGGEIGDIGLKVSDVAPMGKGEKVLLFLKSGMSKGDGTVYNIVGQAQGKYTIDDKEIARKDGFSIVSGQDIIDNNIPVEELIKKIREVK